MSGRHTPRRPAPPSHRSRSPEAVQSVIAEAHWEPGAEPPGVVVTGDAGVVVRTIAFIDLCGFTNYAAVHDNRAAVNLLGEFRARVREVTERRGVRVAKWLGDGAMLVGVRGAPVVATVVELTDTSHDLGLELRGGITTGNVLLAEGDDYIGAVANLAARLCDAAGPRVVLADTASAVQAPSWVHVGSPRSLRLRGFGHLEGFCALRPDRERHWMQD